MMMTMEEKEISYHKNLLDEQNMPDWCGMFVTVLADPSMPVLYMLLYKLA